MDSTKTTKKTRAVASKAKKTAIKNTASSKKNAGAVKKKPSSKVSKAKKEEVVLKLRIRVRAYEHKILDTSVKQIMDTIERLDATVVGPVPLPTETKRYTVNRASFIFKDAREQFEMRVHKRLIDIISPSPKVIDALTNLSLPSGVSIDVKMI